MSAPPAIEVLAGELESYPTIIDAAHLGGWLVAHFRPARTKYGWATAVQGDGKGYVDFTLVHARAHLVWFVEVKTDGERLSPDQRAWGDALITAGAVYRVVFVPSQRQAFCQELVDVPKAAA